MLRRRVSAVSKHEGPTPSFETPRSLSSGAHSRDPLAAPQDEVCGVWQQGYCAGLIAQDTLTLSCSVSSPGATGADSGTPAAILRNTIGAGAPLSEMLSGEAS